MKQYRDAGEKYILTVLLILISIPFWLPLLIGVVDKYYFTPTRTIEDTWDIDIPAGFRQIYHVDTDSFYAKGMGYTLYEVTEAEESFVKGFSFTKESSLEDNTNEIIGDLSIPKSYCPPFDEFYFSLQKYKKQSGSHLVVLYFPDAKRCFFIESYSWDSPPQGYESKR